MTTVTKPCWQVWVRRGEQWQMRSTHDSPGPARLAVLVGRRQDRWARFRIVVATRKVATYVEAPAPTAAQRFREAQADRMVVRRQATAYFKSGSNGTEILQLPKETL